MAGTNQGAKVKSYIYLLKVNDTVCYYTPPSETRVGLPGDDALPQAHTRRVARPDSGSGRLGSGCVHRKRRSVSQQTQEQIALTATAILQSASASSSSSPSCTSRRSSADLESLNIGFEVLQDTLACTFSPQLPNIFCNA